MGKFGIAIVFIVVIAVLAAGFLWFISANNQNGTINPVSSGSNATSTTPTLILGTPTKTTPAGSQSVSDGRITLIYPTTDFRLATSSQQIAVHSYIPPCDADLDFCLYYIGAAYHGTNFESAGIRVEKRSDLTTSAACLTAPPTGFSNFTPTSTTVGDYSVSEFTPIGNAGAGHFAKGTLYRLAYNGACYEFETRIGQSNFANYPSGTIQEFTPIEQEGLQSEIVGILNDVTLSSGETVTFPN